MFPMLNLSCIHINMEVYAINMQSKLVYIEEIYMLNPFYIIYIYYIYIYIYIYVYNIGTLGRKDN